MTMVLAIDTTGSRPAIAALEGHHVLAHWQGRAAQTPLVDGMRDLLRQMDLPMDALPGRIGIVGVATGPGRYARLRAGVAFAKGLAAGLPARLVGVPSAVALRHAAGRPATLFVPAGRDRFYLFDTDRPDNESVSAQDLASYVAPDASIVGDVDDATARELKGRGVHVTRIAPVDVAAAVGRLAADEMQTPSALATDAAHPIYLTSPVRD